MKMFISDSWCYQCGGSGAVYGDDDKVCPTCCGTGRDVSAAGRELLAILKEYFNLVPKP